jgi:hypothetical protein
MNNSGVLGDLIEKGKSGLGDFGKAAKSQLTGFGQATKRQVSPGLLAQKPADEELDQKKIEQVENQQPVEEDPQKAAEAAKAHTEAMVKHLYGVNETKGDKKGKKAKQPQVNKDEKEAPVGQKKTTEEEQKIQQLRSSLHQEYYESLTRPKPQQEEDRPAEKVENEKKMEELEQQDRDKEKPPPLAIQRSQQRSEKFPGASG